MISRSIDQLTCQCRPFRCCQAYSGDQGHHDKPSHPAARHDCLDGDAARDLRIPCADRAARRRASQGRRPPGGQEGRAAEGCPAAGCRTFASGGPSATTPGSCAATASGSAAATACCGSAAAPDAASAPSGGCASSASDATSATPGCRAKGADSDSAAPGGSTFAPDTATSPSAGSSACGAEAACRTDAATAAAFISEGDAITITCTPAAAGWRQAAAGACHYTRSDSAADGRPSTGRKHDGATAASRRTSDASECWRPDYLPNNRASECRRSDCRANHAAGTTRCAADGYAGRGCCADRDPCADNEPRAERRRRPHGSRRRDASCRHGAYGTNRRAGRAKRHATGRPGTERPADRRAGFPPGASGHRAAAGGSATGSRAQSHCPRCATDRTATP
jgi:hypothetical protein